MKDLGAMKKILGMTISRDRKKKELRLAQQDYIKKIVDRFGMTEAKSVCVPLASHCQLSSKLCPKTQEDQEFMKNIPYKSVVGSLMYAMVSTHLDIAHAVGVVSRFMSNPGKPHWETVKYILRYLKGTSDFCLCFGKDKPQLQGFIDFDLGRDLDKQRSTFGYVFTFVGVAISWGYKLQHTVAQSFVEAEYIALSEGAKEMVWLQLFFSELSLKQSNFVMFCDNHSAIFMSKH